MSTGAIRNQPPYSDTPSRLVFPVDCRMALMIPACCVQQDRFQTTRHGIPSRLLDCNYTSGRESKTSTKRSARDSPPSLGMHAWLPSVVIPIFKIDVLLARFSTDLGFTDLIVTRIVHSRVVLWNWKTFPSRLQVFSNFLFPCIKLFGIFLWTGITPGFPVTVATPICMRCTYCTVISASRTNLEKNRLKVIP